MAGDDDQVEEPTPAMQARRVLRAARAGTLATAADGQPTAALITPATAPDGDVLMLLSGLSEHTRHLGNDGRCAVLVAGEPDGPNAQTAPEPDPAMKARWVALHPYAAFYADLPDFRLWRLRPARGNFIGGFARAFRLTLDELACDPAAVAAVAAAEGRIITHCNDDHADALDAIAAAHGHAATGWRMVACDCDGFDLVRDDLVRRVPWPATVDGPGAVRAALVRLAAAARNPG